MAINLEEKKPASSLQKTLTIVLVLSAILALFVFGSRSDFFKEKTSQKTQTKQSVSEIKKIDIDISFLKESVEALKAFPDFPSFYGTSSAVQEGRENPFLPYRLDGSSVESEASSQNKTAGQE
ncbi:MAG: hypothetical protein WCX23_00085 [Candidatus Paceibacterota bacterium]|jgi:hypothetical protein|nr:hypothetical protein [Candidatus Paceibacterota bacterium]MDD4875334.1 hypothetical protein [Candidatus Paceibacterota bacterium]